MERLTYKHNDYYLHKAMNTDDLKYKLGQLEDIEEELGIDLITLFKALRVGIWYKGHKDIYFVKGVCLDLVGEFFELWVEGHKILDGLQIHLKDYGKTWALTKEEFEYEKEN